MDTDKPSKKAVFRIFFIGLLLFGYLLFWITGIFCQHFLSFKQCHFNIGLLCTCNSSFHNRFQMQKDPDVSGPGPYYIYV